LKTKIFFTIMTIFALAFAACDNGGNDGTAAPQKTLLGIAVNTYECKTVYQTDEDFDPDGLVVTAIFSDETTVPVTGYQVDSSRYDKNIADFYTITVTYQSKKDKFIVTVVDPSAPDLPATVSISPSGSVMANTPLTASYSGTEIVTFQWHKDGEDTRVTAGSTYTPTTAGSYTVTASAAGYTSKTSAAVTVLPSGTDSFLVTFSGFGNEEINLDKNTENNLSKSKSDGIIITVDGCILRTDGM